MRVMMARMSNCERSCYGLQLHWFSQSQPANLISLSAWSDRVVGVAQLLVDMSVTSPSHILGSSVTSVNDSTSSPRASATSHGYRERQTDPKARQTSKKITDRNGLLWCCETKHCSFRWWTFWLVWSWQTDPGLRRLQPHLLLSSPPSATDPG